MAKETMIVFVYDTECLDAESDDDPVSAVLYFHPSWVSDTQKLALCGQLMGTSYFLKDSLFRPRIISLQNGKFILKEYGRFVLAIGTDRNISDYLLEYRANILISLIQLYHRDLQTIYDQFPLQSQYKNLGEKLYHIFETYLPILQYRGGVFHNVLKLRVPKTASHVFLEAIQTLQNCQQTKGVLGGAILYHNKIVATQLPEQLMKHLLITDPLHIRPTSESIQINQEFHIPNGVLMLVIYIEHNDYKRLQMESQRAQNLQGLHQMSSSGGGSVGGGSTGGTGANANTSVVWPFQYTKRKIRRDSSLIFTHIPEEDGGGVLIPSESIENNNNDPLKKKDENIVSSQQQSQSGNNPGPIRPKSLMLRSTIMSGGGGQLPPSLKLKSKDVKDHCIPQFAGISAISFDESDSYPEYIGRTSVCSTPMAENKVLTVGNVMSICSTNMECNKENVKKSTTTTTTTTTGVRPCQEQRNILKQEFEKFFYNFITNPNKLEKRNSLMELHRTVKKFSKNISLKKIYRSLKNDVNRNCDSPDYYLDNLHVDNVKNGNNTQEGKKKKKNGSPELPPERDSSISSDNSDENTNHVSRTITDPTYPVFNADGLPISRSLFQEFLEKYYKLWAETGEESENDDDVVQLIEEFKDFDYELKKLDESLRNTNNALKKADRNFNIEMINTNNSSNTKSSPIVSIDKKSLSLPIKSISTSNSINNMKEYSSMVTNSGIGGVPLTPLMAKLSILAQNEKEQRDDCMNFPTKRSIRNCNNNNNNNILSSSISFNCEEAMDAMTTLTTNPIDPDNNKSSEEKPECSSTNDNLKRVELYLCGQQNMTLILVMEENCCRQQKIVQKMFDVCVAKFPHMEQHLSETLNVNVETEKHRDTTSFTSTSPDNPSYSFICLDDDWEMLQRSGHWSPLENNTLEEIHGHLRRSRSQITDIIVRSYDNVMFGCQTGGRNEYFYKMTAKSLSGIPPPSDAMGAVVMTAKNQLERDHSYVLF